VTLNITLTPALFAEVQAGRKWTVTHKDNPRINRYFTAKNPRRAKINGTLYEIVRTEAAPGAWIVHIGKAL
jgi:hypothetical protein